MVIVSVYDRLIQGFKLISNFFSMYMYSGFHKSTRSLKLASELLDVLWQKPWGDACIIDRLAKQQAIITVITTCIHSSHHLSDVSLAKSLQLLPGNNANFRLFMICLQISE